MAVDDEVGLRIIGRYQDQNIVHTLHFDIAAQTTDDHVVLSNLCAGWDLKMSSAWVARHIDTYELIGVKAFNKTGNNKRPGMLAIETAGSVVGIETPSPVCRSITLYTDSDNHWRRGRLMLSGCDTTMFDTDDGSVTAAEQTALATLAALLLTTVVAGGDEFRPILPSGTGIGGPYGVEPLTAFLVRKTPACIRSRRIRGFNIG